MRALPLFGYLKQPSRVRRRHAYDAVALGSFQALDGEISLELHHPYNRDGRERKPANLEAAYFVHARAERFPCAARAEAREDERCFAASSVQLLEHLVGIFER